MMEVDVSSIGERKESGDSALLRLHELSEIASEDISLNHPHGQLIVSCRYHHLPPLKLTPIDSPVSAYFVYAGTSMADEGLTPRLNQYGQQLCGLCGTRLNRVKGKLHKHENGRI